MDPFHEGIEERHGERCIPISRAVDHADGDQCLPRWIHRRLDRRRALQQAPLAHPQVQIRTV